MRQFTLLLLAIPLVLLFSSCNKDLDVNAGWQDITVVYGLLDQTSDTTYIKITKAFLGPGDALQFAKIPDSSNYPDKLDVKLQEYNAGNLVRTLNLDTVTIHNKEAGDSIFYYPDQLMYFTAQRLNQNYTYKLLVTNTKTGKEVSSETSLVYDFEIMRPATQASFPPGQNFQVKWTPAKNGKRYQLVIRFYYDEYLKSDPKIKETKYVDWRVFNDIKAPDVPSTQPFDYYFPSDGFYANIGNKIDTNSLVTRTALYCDFLFSVASMEMNTYMEVNEPSLSLVQERPDYSNIVNGIGLFAARFNKKNPDTLNVSQITRDELKVNKHTSDLGF